MDGIKKFEDFLDRMQGLIYNAKKQGHIIVRIEDLENTFPELKESEDERIRNVLIYYFNRYKEQEECGIKTFYGIPTDNILAWLEKQGNHKPTDNQFTSEQASLLDKHIEKLHNRDIKRVNQHVTVRPRHILL